MCYTKHRNVEGCMTLTIESAKQIIDTYYDILKPTYKEDIEYMQALEFLIEQTKEAEYMVQLGSWYYEQRQYDLAEEQYLKASKSNNIDAYECLGYIYYYGKVGEPDYEKAYTYLKKASDKNDAFATFKLADMYRYGYYVKKDYTKYVSLIKELYMQIQGSTDTFDPVPEVYKRLADIYIEEGNEEKAVQLLLVAKEFQSQRLMYTTYEEDLTNMKQIVLDLYSIIEFNPEYMDLFDLYYALQYPCTIQMYIHDEVYTIEAKVEDNYFYISMNDKNYENVDDFFLHAMIHDEPLSMQYVNVNYIEVIE